MTLKLKLASNIRHFFNQPRHKYFMMPSLSTLTILGILGINVIGTVLNPLHANTLVLKSTKENNATAKSLATISIKPDMTNKSGFDATCQTLTPLTLTTAKQIESLNKPQLQAWVICKDIALLRQTTTWAYQTISTLDLTNSAVINSVLQAQLSHLQKELSASRAVLNYLRQHPLTAGDSLELRPQTWQVDLDSDNTISRWESRFFALPNRNNETEFNLSMPTANDDATVVQLQALIKTDATDVLWALSYHEFIEGAVELLRSQQIDFNAFKEGGFKNLFTLQDKTALIWGHTLISDGLATSLAMRKSALAETKNDYEWIPNPKQTNSAFPLLLDEADYAIWETFITELQALWNGETVLVVSETIQTLTDSPTSDCGAGKGLDIAKLFIKHPPQHILNADEFTEACAYITAEHAESKLPAMLAERYKNNALSPNLLRYLYWIN